MKLSNGRYWHDITLSFGDGKESLVGKIGLALENNIIGGIGKT